ncbi:hypothetical protein [Bogoriella caseilytica]|nr:hypothetical protein [Bogoriella caseilytica]
MIAIAGADVLAAAPLWRALLAVLLIVDIAAGCVANFTSGTDTYYAERPTSRWVFILVHWHLVATGLLLDVAVVPLIVVTVFALLSATVVNLLHGRQLQVAAGGLLLTVGVVGVTLWLPSIAPPFLVATAAMFIVKVVLAFAVTHHRLARDPASQASGE